MVSAGVAERTREFGIRMALGATAADSIRSLAAAGVVVAAVGAAIGISLAWMAVTVFDSFPALFNVDKHDTTTFVVVPAMLLVVASIASVVPALRILEFDPARILRE